MKLEAARRLELTEPVEVGDHVEGHYGSVKVNARVGLGAVAGGGRLRRVPAEATCSLKW